jgi:predicted  nucleic acid-binding Zn-ribbon protein
MPGPAAILRKLHHLRRNASDLRDEINRGPLTLKSHQAKVAKREENVRESQEAVKRLKVTIHEKEGELRAKNQQIEKHQRQLNEAAGKKEYDALKAEIAADKQTVAKLEDEIIDLMTEMETRAAHLPELQQEVDRAKKESAKVVDDIQTRRNQLTDRLNEVHQEIKAAEDSLPADLRPQYDRLVAARGEDALAGVQGRTCLACYTEITAQQNHELGQQQFVLCKSCGRMLYLADSAV